MDSQPRLCPHFHRAVELIGRRWTGALIFVLLQERAARFGQLRAAVPEITDRMLAERLRELEEEKIVARTALPEISASEYSLTERGRALAGAVSAIATWSHEWLAESRDCPPDCGPAGPGAG